MKLPSFLWDFVQKILGAPEYKKQLYRSVLGNNGKLLDFGCATGHLSDAFIKDFDYYGIDSNRDAIAEAQHKFLDYPNMHFSNVNLFVRPFGANFFDEILFCHTAHHVDDQLFKRLLQEFHYCLKSGGTVHLIDPVLQINDSKQQRFMRWIDFGRHPRTLNQFYVVLSTSDFQIGKPSFHTPQGALIQDCDYVHIALRKK